jgi:hypothetical protein
VVEEFKRVLARVQSDYGFYIDCQANAAVALSGYDLSADERSALTDPKKLADVFRGGIGVTPLRLTVTISGKHDWVNRAPRPKPPKPPTAETMIGTEVEAIRRASTAEARTRAAGRLMELIG